MKITTVKGTNDYLPKEAELRTYLQNQILETYFNSGFNQIMTPILEDTENLNKSEGGDNLNLIFKVLKRGRKLEKAIQEQQFHDLSDIGLRYDLTLPLSRYYANNRAKLVLPMKCIQIDKAYRAENPQKGRLREFLQCDIDIIGSDSIYSEIELICLTAKALLNIGIDDFVVKINDRNLLNLLLLNFGFKDAELDSLCISFDKVDKIGIEGLKKELIKKQLDESCIEKFMAFLVNGPTTLEQLTLMNGAEAIIEKLKEIICTVSLLALDKYRIEFDISLVRGQGYYTGTVFEIKSEKYKGSIAAGGRYDNLIGKFINEQIPAVGFSIGFERIFDILMENAYAVPNKKKKIVILYEKGNFIETTSEAEKYRIDYDVAIYEKPAKAGKFLDKLKDCGYYGFIIFGESNKINIFDRS